MGKLMESLELIKLLRIDVYMALFIFSYGISQVPMVELIQDKVCLNELELSESTCNSLSSGTASTAELQANVLARATSIRNYQTLVATLPGVIFSFFFGYWIDKYPSHIRFLLILPCAGLLISSLIMAYQCIYFEVAIIYSLWSQLTLGLGGSLSLSLAASFTYAAKKTPQKFRSIRFAIVDLFIFTAYPLAVAVGSKILAAQPWFGSERRNFTAIFVTSSVTTVIAIIWAFVFIDDSGPSEEKSNAQTETAESGSASTAGTSTTEIDLNDGAKTSTVESNVKEGAWAIAADIFNFRNVELTIKTFLRDRPNNGRLKVILLALSVLIVYISLIGESTFGYQYAEIAFLWDYKYYSNTYAYLQLVQSLGTVVGSYFFKNTLALGDIEVAAIGTLSHFIGNLIKGIPTVACYITGALAFCLSGIAIPATRSCLTRIIDFTEIGQILAIISCMQAIGPMAASVETTAVFNATIDFAPGTTYHVLAASMIFPLIVQFWISLTTDAQGDDKKYSTKVRFEAGKDKETVDIQGLNTSESGKQV